MTTRATTRLISETQKALDVKEGVHLPERDRFLVAPRPDIFPLEPPDADWGRHDRLDGWDPDRLGSPRGEAQRVDVERPSVPIEDIAISCVRQVQQKAMSMKSGRGWRGAPVSRSAVRARRRQAANLTASFLCSLR